MSKKSATDIIMEACDRFCNDYCKYGEKLNQMEGDEFEKLSPEWCKNCPINELY